MIKTRPYRYFAVFMAFLVLTSSTGFGLVEHSCMMRGKSVEVAALKKAETGCKMCKPKTTSGVQIASSLFVFEKKACCEESHKYQKLEVLCSSSSFSKILKSLPLGAALGEHMGSPLRVFPFFLSSLLLSSSNTTSPPLLPKNHGRTMLSFVQCFLI